MTSPLKEDWQSDSSIAQAVIFRLKKHLPEYQHEAINELYRRTSQSEGQARGALFELKLQNSLTDDSLRGASLGAQPSWFPPSQGTNGKDLDLVLSNGLACELKSVRVPATNTADLALHMTEAQCHRALLGGVNFGNTAETRMRALLKTAVQRIEDKKLHLATHPVWLVMEAAPDTDWFRDAPSRLRRAWSKVSSGSRCNSEVRLAVCECGDKRASRVTALSTHGADQGQIRLLRQSLLDVVTVGML